ncbi:hypothetical protein NO108_00781 [Planktothrix rubescens]|jgi:hypothetical protein|nr:hypothetical protein NO108_00781 [Planktothrix rubescens]
MPKNCYLTDVGLKKVEEALITLTPSGNGSLFHRSPKKCKTNFPKNVNFLQLEITVGINRGTLEKILYKKGGVNKKTLEELFTAIFIEEIKKGIDYKYEILPKTITHPEPNNNEPSVKIIVSQNGIPFIVRRNTKDKIVL